MECWAERRQSRWGLGFERARLVILEVAYSIADFGLWIADWVNLTPRLVSWVVLGADVGAGVAREGTFGFEMMDLAMLGREGTCCCAPPRAPRLSRSVRRMGRFTRVAGKLLPPLQGDSRFY
jgi:hypothetical protein